MGAIALGCIAELYLAGQTERDMQPTQGLTSAKQAQEIFQEVDNKPSEAILCRTLANAYLACKNTDDAVSAASLGVDLANKAEDKRLLAEAQIVLAQTLLDAAAMRATK